MKYSTTISERRKEIVTIFGNNASGRCKDQTARDTHVKE